MTAVDYLRHCHGYSRRMITRLKQDCGSLVVNGRQVERLTVPLSAGDRVEVRLASEEQGFLPNAALCVPVVYEDEDVIVVSKPADMPVHPSYRHREDTLANALAALCPSAGFHPINRLDRDTSGLCVVAKNSFAAGRLSGAVSKVYFAVVEGEVSPMEGVLSFPIARERESMIRRCVSSEGKPAVTRYRTILRGNGHTLLEIRLETGRTHQIRVHFAHIGHPLAGDDLYGGGRRWITRQALHCGEIHLTQPVTGEALCLKTPIPGEMERILRPESDEFGKSI